MVSLGGLGRLAQGMSGVGSKLAPAYGAAKAAAPAVGGAIQGVGMGAGFAVGQLAAQPVKGFVGFFANFIPENIYGWFLWMGAFIYWLDWQTGFNAAATANFHLSFAIVAFLLIGLTQRFLNATALLSTTGIFLSLIGFMNATDIRGRGFAAVAFMIAFYFYSRVNAPGFFKVLPIIAFVDVYAMPVFRDVVLGYAANINYVSFVAAFVFNRILFPIWLWFGAIALYENTRVARKVLMLIIVFYFVVSLPTLTATYKSKISALTPEEKEVAGSIWARFQTNLQRVLSGEFLRTPVASAYEGLERTFGFGEPKEEPKLGLTLVQDSTMLKKYNLDFKAPEPSFVMRVPNPFPADTKKPYIEVTNIDCSDKLKKLTKPLKFESGITSKGVTPTEGKPVAVFYNGPDGGSQVRCVLKEDSKWESGDYTIAAEVDYMVDASAFLTTAFIREDQDEALRRQGIDPAVVNKIPPATAKYDNVPVTLTWGPPDLTKSPASIALIPASTGSITAAKANLLITVYVSKNTGWENSEIKVVKSLTLTVPKGVTLVEGGSCDFELPREKKVEGGEGGVTEYNVNDARIRKDGNPRFIGDAIRFDCGVNVLSEALSGADWAPARFDLSGRFIFTTKLEGISFTVEGGEKAASQPTQQQLQDKCKETGGTWKAEATPPECDCGTGKKWDVYPNGCVASSPSTPPASAPSTSPPQAIPETGASSSAGAGTATGTLSGCSSPQPPKTAEAYNSYKSTCVAQFSGGTWLENAAAGCCKCPTGKVWPLSNNGCVSQGSAAPP